MVFDLTGEMMRRFRRRDKMRKLKKLLYEMVIMGRISKSAYIEIMNAMVKK